MVGQERQRRRARKPKAQKDLPLEVERRRLNQALDRLELHLRALEKEIERARQELEGLIPTAKVHFKYVRCGRADCRCQKSRGHGPYAYASERVGGKVRTYYLGKAPKLPEGAVDKGAYRRLLRRLEGLRKERERIFRQIEQALELLR